MKKYTVQMKVMNEDKTLNVRTTRTVLAHEKLEKVNTNLQFIDLIFFLVFSLQKYIHCIVTG